MSSPRKGGSHIRIKQEKSDGFEVHEARSKLDGVLQTLVDKAEDSAVVSEDESINIKLSPEQSTSREIPGTSASPSKRGSGKNPRKRRKKDTSGNEPEKSSIDTTRLQHTYVMKLFDRSVDLAQFDNGTQLYAICREWMLNQPNTRRSARRSPTPDPSVCDDSDDEVRNVYSLPPPRSMPDDYVDGRDIRIPSPVPQPDEEFRMYDDPNQAPTASTLLSDHLKRWKKVRQKWKESSQANQERYAESYATLKNMYDRQ
ncbi:protein lin-37 homolog [Ptychodera flava]|uniref:protein lin-37 homolog n=1 Tax=Ptychodera flava TaxID=63121 RepID=UPI00396A2DF0